MADNIGVTNTESRPGASSGTPAGNAGGSAWYRKNKKLVWLGGGLAAFLLMGHKGSKSASGAGGTSDPNSLTQDQLQAQSDALAAEQSALESGTVLPPGGVAPTTVDTGGGTYSPAAPQASTGQVGPINEPAITVNVPASPSAPPGPAPTAPVNPAASQAPAGKGQPTSAPPGHAIGHSSRYEGEGTYVGSGPANPALKAVGHSPRYRGPGTYKPIETQAPKKPPTPLQTHPRVAPAPAHKPAPARKPAPRKR